ncbi:MAG: DNA repair protein RecO [Eubacterium sp.]|nr:DNA repair protein RecO [Eubacterium sp.]MCM1216456.1 DNA repair protein RecO [Lachnospiraceae bacterium]MCM1240278.1 DNA repair protein RecO [Lachnospiraceae bacterium]MCM1304309.1 DNA repair protein RecO [Butyrivibrio sp.]MCM1409244.1 DNA repair protein RecO [Lachnospiraceae bacterium]
MQEYIWVTGIILKQTPVGEYDRHISLLTKERGKISAFARGARKPANRLAAATNPFSFGTFKLYEGKSSYTVAEADIQNYFEELRTDYIGACYGMYFAEIADYYTRENNDEREMMKLLYQTLRALCAPSLPDPLIRCIYECRAIAVNGEFPGPPEDEMLEESTVYALRYIASSPVEKLYTFNVTETVLRQLQQVSARYMKRFVGREFKSLEVLQTLC